MSAYSVTFLSAQINSRIGRSYHLSPIVLEITEYQSGNKPVIDPTSQVKNDAIVFFLPKIFGIYTYLPIWDKSTGEVTVWDLDGAEEATNGNNLSSFGGFVLGTN